MLESSNKDDQVYYCTHNQGANVYFCLLVLFSSFYISHSNVMNMETFVIDFTGTTKPRILKFDTNIVYDKL